MAKFRIEVDLDFIEEGMNLDEVLKDEILNSLTLKLNSFNETKLPENRFFVLNWQKCPLKLPFFKY